jgi:plastocyanin
LDHTFDPDIITANVGDTILFQFYPRNYSVVRAA